MPYYLPLEDKDFIVARKSKSGPGGAASDFVAMTFDSDRFEYQFAKITHLEGDPDIKGGRFGIGKVLNKMERGEF